MASSHLPIPISIISVVLLIITSISISHSHNLGDFHTNAVTVTECGPSLMLLAPCSPFVQGVTPLPALACCGNMKEFIEEDEDSRCLCLLLSESNLGTLPINRALVLQLPSLCNLHTNTSTCSGLVVPVPVPPPSHISPSSPVTFEPTTNSTITHAPVVTVAPRPSSIKGFNSKNTGKRLEAESYIAIILVTALVLLGRML